MKNQSITEMIPRLLFENITNVSFRNNVDQSSFNVYQRDTNGNNSSIYLRNEYSHSSLDFEFDWINKINNNNSLPEAAAFVSSDTMTDNYTIISDLFVFDDLNDYINKLNYSTLVNFTSYYDIESDNNSIFGNISCTLNNSLGNYSECINSVATVKNDGTKNWWALILVVVPCLTIFGNVLVILAVKRERTLQTITNYFIVSLAVADLLVAMVVMPFAVYVLVYGTWTLPGVVCDFYIAMDVMCSTSSIFNLVAISVDRYIAVTRPIEYAKHKNNRRVWLTILLVWAVSAAIGSPIVLGLNNTPDRIPDLCLFYHTDFIIYSSLSSFYIPCLTMVFLYYRIFSALRDREKKKRANRKSNLGDIKSSCIIENIANTRSGYSVARFAETALGAAALVAPGIEEPTNTASGSNEDEDETPLDPVVVISNEKSTEFFLATVTEEAASSTPSAPITGNMCGDSIERTNMSKKEHKHKASSSTGSRFNLRKTNKASKKKGDKISARKERKATKTLAIVLGVFLICWVPFFTCNTMDALCSKMKKDCQPGVAAFIATSWLGYMNSFVNPVIYTLFNPEFRKAFRKLISF